MPTSPHICQDENIYSLQAGDMKLSYRESLNLVTVNAVFNIKFIVTHNIIRLWSKISFKCELKIYKTVSINLQLLEIVQHFDI